MSDKETSGTQQEPVTRALKALAQALRENPVYMAILLIAYLVGFLLNLYLLQKNVTFLAIFENLSIGLAWSALVAVIVVFRVADCFPLSGREPLYVFYACQGISMGSGGTLIILIGISKGMQGFAVEFQEAYGHDLHLFFKVILSTLWIGCLVWFFIIAIKGTRRFVLSTRTQAS